MKSLLARSAILSILALSASTQLLAVATTTTANSDPTTMEKCFGVVKKGMNDCPTHSTSCAGSATVDGQKDAYILLPKGTCLKIVGGSLKSS